MMSEPDDAFLHVHLDHVQPKSQLQDYTVTSGSAIWLQNSSCFKTAGSRTLHTRSGFCKISWTNTMLDAWNAKFSSFFCVPNCCDGPYKIEYWSLQVLIKSLFGSSPSPWL